MNAALSVPGNPMGDFAPKAIPFPAAVIMLIAINMFWPGLLPSIPTLVR